MTTEVANKKKEITLSTRQIAWLEETGKGDLVALLKTAKEQYRATHIGRAGGYNRFDTTRLLGFRAKHQKMIDDIDAVLRARSNGQP